MIHVQQVTIATALVAASHAQSFVTSPRGFDAVEGNAAYLHFSLLDRRFQQIDDTHRGATFVVHSLGFRRDGGTTGGGTDNGARIADIEISLGLASFGVLHGVFDDNHLAGSRVVTYARKRTNLPDWTGHAGTPAPFDLVMPFDAPFPYAGSASLVIDFTHENLTYVSGSGDGMGSLIDRHHDAAASAAGTLLDAGCTATGMPLAFTQMLEVENSGPGLPQHGMRLRIGAAFAPPHTPVSLNIDVADAQLTIPGLCGTLHALPTISLVVDPSTAAGVLREAWLSFPHAATLVGRALVTQLLALDIHRSGLPIVLSSSLQATIPSDPNGRGVACAYGALPWPATDGTLYFGGGVVMQLGI